MKKLSFALAMILLMSVLSGVGVFAESAEIPTLNVDVDTSEMTPIPVDWSYAMGIIPWVGEESGRLFDGQYGVPSDEASAWLYFRTDEEKGTKMGGEVTERYVTVSFGTEETSAIRYYTLYTGFDCALETGRNPVAWILYGVDEEGEMQLIHEVASNDTVSTGMQDLNCTPYTYQVPEESVGAYSEYVWQFYVEGDYFQLNEIVLFGDVGVEIIPEDSDDQPADTAPTVTAPAITDSASNDTDSDADAFPIFIVIAAVAVVAVAAVIVIVIVVLKKKALKRHNRLR